MPVSASLIDAEAFSEPVRMGLVALATDLTLEHDLHALLPEAVRLHVTRLAYANPTTPENLRAMAPGIAAAADLLVPGADLAAIGFGCTSGAVVIGDAAVGAAIGRVRPGVPVCAPASAAVQGFRHLGVRRIALLTPYVAQTTAPVAAYFAQAGLRVVSTHGLDMADDRDIARLPPAAIAAAARHADHPRAEALFVSCTATPVLPLIPTLERALGKPVLSSNQALGWAMLAAAGLVAPGPGRLFAPLADAA
ncbi:MAG TPA: ectoine utilization protein EutA [Paracoccus sp.]|nr:ectoine utilization protein EutA [Paracoccus sp. (in: a-proteobacteria)]